MSTNYFGRINRTWTIITIIAIRLKGHMGILWADCSFVIISELKEGVMIIGLRRLLRNTFPIWTDIAIHTISYWVAHARAPPHNTTRRHGRLRNASRKADPRCDLIHSLMACQSLYVSSPHHGLMCPVRPRPDTPRGPHMLRWRHMLQILDRRYPRTGE